MGLMIGYLVTVKIVFNDSIGVLEVSDVNKEENTLKYDHAQGNGTNYTHKKEILHYGGRASEQQVDYISFDQRESTSNQTVLNDMVIVALIAKFEKKRCGYS